MAKLKFTKAEVGAALEKTGGLVAPAARLLSVSNATIRNYMERYPELAEIRRTAVEALLDGAEIQLANHVRRGNVVATIFLLKTLGKGRGYRERTEIAGAEDAPPVVLQHELRNMTDEELQRLAGASNGSAKGKRPR